MALNEHPYKVAVVDTESTQGFPTGGGSTWTCGGW